MRKRDKATGDSGFTTGSVSIGRITPTDVQQKEFRVARFGGGYRMREVDEFLDQVTDALTALIAENDDLRAGRAAVRGPSAAAPPRPAANDEDRTAVDAFLQREKGFLQSLGGLVQGHAEELKEMVRAARRAAPAGATLPAAAAAPATSHAAGPTPEDAQVPSPSPATSAGDGTSSAGGESEAPEGSLDDPGASTPLAQAEATADDPIEMRGEHAEAGRTSEPEDPIRLEEPEPARSRRADEEPEGSLRELFWGEE